jgi:hypothetical protein
MEEEEMRRCFTVCLILLAGFAAAPRSEAQKLVPQVKLTLDRLPLDKQKRLTDFESAIQTYLSDTDWTGDTSWELPLNLQIYLQDVSASFEDRYSGVCLISNMSDLQYYDKYWKFPYLAGDRLIHDENMYEPFTGVVNFYVYLILAGEFDKYSVLGGTPYYEKAKAINDQARFNSTFIYGWDERGKLLQSLMGLDAQPFRRSKYCFFAAFDATAQSDTTAPQMGREGLTLLEGVRKKNPGHKETKDFLNAHYVDIAKIFRNDSEAMDRLMAVDTVHAEAYRRIRDGQE